MLAREALYHFSHSASPENTLLNNAWTKKKKGLRKSENILN
jgi:hypothetical protein